MNYTFIVAAAGSGKRMKLGYPKQFLEFNDKPIFIHTLEVIQNHNLINNIIVVTGKEYIDDVKMLCEKYKINKLQTIVEGGKERQDSIYNALKYVKNGIVGVQDGVRPFITKQYITKAYENIFDADGVLIGVPVKDTIKIVEDGFVVNTPSRSTLVAAQTPQVFKTEILKKAYEKAKKDDFLGTDDSSLVERIGGKVKLIMGSYENIKITTPEDLKFLEGR